MREVRYGGNLFLLDAPDGKTAAYAVTTNGIVKADGKAVMGAGIAKYARDSFDGIDELLGGLLKAHGNHAYFMGAHMDPNRPRTGRSPSVFVVTFPTKNHWRDGSDPALIARSARELLGVADRNNLDVVYAPMPGCSNGGLDYARDVRGLLAGILDDRFHVAVPPEIYDRLD